MDGMKLSAFFIVLVACQLSSGAAYRNTETRWLTQQLSHDPQLPIGGPRRNSHDPQVPIGGPRRNSHDPQLPIGGPRRNSHDPQLPIGGPRRNSHDPQLPIGGPRRNSQPSTQQLTHDPRSPIGGPERNSLPSTNRNGYRADLVDEEHKLHTRYNLSPEQRIARAAERSRSRGFGLDGRAKAAPYSNGKGNPGRKTLQVTNSSFEASVIATPGSYSMSFYIGTPPQQFIAIADTGSDLVWIQCAQCTECIEQASPSFDPVSSSTYASLSCSGTCDALGNNLDGCSPTCKYNYSYGDQSTTRGDFAADTVSLAGIAGPNTTIPNFVFGCGLQNQGTFTGTDGIVGLARGPISFNSQIALFLNIAPQFAYCLVPKNENETVTSPIIFGEAAVPENVSAVAYTPLLTPYEASVVPYYYVNLLGISVGGLDLNISLSAFQIDASGNGGTIFDSGTTYTLLATEAYRAVLDEYKVQLTTFPTVDLSQRTGLELCYAITGSTSVEIPSLVFHFENADFDLPFYNIMVLFGSQAQTYMCLTLLESSGFNIFGSTQQQGFQVIHKEDTLQIGWLPEDCMTL